MLYKAKKIGVIVRRGAKALQILLILSIYSCTIVACSSSNRKSGDGDELATEVKIDCEQEANKYRKPCRGTRW